MTTAPSDSADVTAVAREYYNSSDADTFYFEVWGGEDIHVGLYRSDEEPIADASRRTVDRMASKLEGLGPASTVLDLGAGYGGAARQLAERSGCRVVCLNLSEAENERNRAMNEARGLADKIEVIDGAFETVPLGDASVDFCWSQDAILHSGDRVGVLREVDRVLKPGGRFVFTDPMRADDAELAQLQPILDRIHLADLGSPEFYLQAGKEIGWEDLGYEDLSEQLPKHYARVLAETELREDDLSGRISPDYLARMKTGLRHWIDGGRAGRLAWGVFHFRKP